MNFNDIQSAWNSDRDSGHVPDRLALLRSPGMPLDKIRKNLRNEFVYQALSIALIGFLPAILPFNPSFLVWFYVTYGIFVAITSYYLVKLFWFYKRVSTQNSNTKDSLYETYYDIRLNIEMYKTFSFSLVPFVLIFIVMAIVSVNKSAVVQMIRTGIFPTVLLVQFVVGFAVTIIMMALATEWWVYRFYGRYANEIKRQLDALKEE